MEIENRNSINFKEFDNRKIYTANQYEYENTKNTALCFLFGSWN